MRVVIKNPIIVSFILILAVGCSEESSHTKKADSTVNMGTVSNELDGKAIICKSYYKEKFPRVGIDGFRFEQGNVWRDRIVTKNNQVTIRELGTINPTTYHTSTESVSWWRSFELNRKTLILYTRKSSASWEYEETHKCKVYPNLNEYLKNLKPYVIEQKREVEKRMEGNKI